MFATHTRLATLIDARAVFEKETELLYGVIRVPLAIAVTFASIKAVLFGIHLFSVIQVALHVWFQH